MLSLPVLLLRSIPLLFPTARFSGVVLWVPVEGGLRLILLPSPIFLPSAVSIFLCLLMLTILPSPISLSLLYLPLFVHSILWASIAALLLISFLGFSSFSTFRCLSLLCCLTLALFWNLWFRLVCLDCLVCLGLLFRLYWMVCLGLLLLKVNGACAGWEGWLLVFEATIDCPFCLLLLRFWHKTVYYLMIRPSAGCLASLECRYSEGSALSSHHWAVWAEECLKRHPQTLPPSATMVWRRLRDEKMQFGLK